MKSLQPRKQRELVQQGYYSCFANCLTEYPWYFEGYVEFFAEFKIFYVLVLRFIAEALFGKNCPRGKKLNPEFSIYYCHEFETFKEAACYLLLKKYDDAMTTEACLPRILLYLARPMSYLFQNYHQSQVPVVAM